MTEFQMNEIAMFLEKVRSLDLDPIAYQLMIAKTGPQWTKTKTVKAISRYLRFLYLVHQYPSLQLAPTYEIDQVWHQHILDTQKYAADCQWLFGRLIHHFPYFGVRNSADRHALLQAHAVTQALHLKHFGEPLGEGSNHRNRDDEMNLSHLQPADCEALLDDISATSGCAALQAIDRPRPRVEIHPELLQHLHLSALGENKCVA
ncbi:glycine-rich domain-containing protein [Egbenema bharatensis]|uniref:glycine-rich domain-containing protein n=1 Tax=Egbenema bharatensis TaxID=3463334 RepID=UPI003A86F112